MSDMGLDIIRSVQINFVYLHEWKRPPPIQKQIESNLQFNAFLKTS